MHMSSRKLIWKSHSLCMEKAVIKPIQYICSLPHAFPDVVPRKHMHTLMVPGYDGEFPAPPQVVLYVCYLYKQWRNLENILHCAPVINFCLPRYRGTWEKTNTSLSGGVRNIIHFISAKRRNRFRGVSEWLPDNLNLDWIQCRRKRVNSQKLDEGNCSSGTSAMNCANRGSNHGMTVIGLRPDLSHLCNFGHATVFANTPVCTLLTVWKRSTERDYCSYVNASNVIKQSRQKILFHYPTKLW